MTATPAQMMTEKIGPVYVLHMEGLITKEELNDIMNRIVKKYEVKP